MGLNDETLKLAGVTPTYFAKAEAELDALERHLGRPVPTALRELLVLEEWPAVLAENSNSDHPLPVAQLASAVENDLLVFMIENQSVCRWGVPVAGPDDPPVMVLANDGRGDAWATAATRFSTWFECQVRDRQLLARCRIAANIQALPDAWLDELRDNFDQGATTHRWPGERNLRFSAPAGALLLWDTTDQCDWWISPSGRDISELLDLLPLRHGFDGAVYALQPRDEVLLTKWLRKKHIEG